MFRLNNLKRDYDGRTWEIDILAADGTEVVVVEVKTTLKVRDVDHFLQTLCHFHRLMPEYGDKLAYGAAAYLKADEGSAVYAEEQGLFVIRATGSSMRASWTTLEPRTRARIRYSHAPTRSV